MLYSVPIVVPVDFSRDSTEVRWRMIGRLFLLIFSDGSFTDGLGGLPVFFHFASNRMSTLLMTTEPHPTEHNGPTLSRRARASPRGAVAIGFVSLPFRQPFLHAVPFGNPCWSAIPARLSTSGFTWVSPFFLVFSFVVTLG